MPIGDVKMEIKSKFQKGHFVPLDQVRLKEGEIVELRGNGRKLFVLNPKLVLTAIMPVWEWNQVEDH